MSFVSKNSVMRNRLFFIPLVITLVVLAFASNAFAKSVRMNVLAHYGVKGLTTGQAGSQSMLFGENGFKPSGTVAKIVRSGSGVELQIRVGLGA